MALSPADFYAYSRATGAPIPDDPEERAKLAPDVVAFRRGQLQSTAPQESEGFDLGGALALGAALAGAGLAGLAARRGLRVKPSIAAPKVETILPETLARAQTAAQSQDFGAVGSLVRELPTPQAPPSPRQPLTGQTSRLPRRQPGSFAELTDIEQEITAEAKAGELLNQLLEEQREIDKENKFQARVLQSIESKEKAGAKNVLAELRREEEAKGFSPRSYVESTGAVAPLEDLTTIQANDTPVIASQQVNAVESGEDQFTGRQLLEVQRDTDTVADRLPVIDQVNTQQAAAQEFLAKELNASPQIDLDATYTYKDLQEAGLPDFEINARMQAYANTGEKALLNPGVNSKTLGHAEFLKVLGVRNAKIDNQLRLIDGELVNPEGDVRMSAFARTQPNVTEKLTESSSRPYDPTSESVTGLTGSVSVAPATFKENVQLSEQYDKAIEDFRAEWDLNVRKNVEHFETGQPDYSDIVMPARAERLVDADDLDIPVRIEKDSEGRVLNRTLYRDILSPETVAQVESGQQVKLDVPYMVNKGRAYLDYRRNPTLENKATALDYKRTGRALVNKYNKIVGPYEGSKYIAEIQEGRFFEPGETGVTPEGGRGSERGKLTGGVTEELLSEELVPLKYAFTAQEGKLKTQVLGFNQQGTSFPVDTLDELKQLGSLTDAQGNPLRVSAAQQQRFIMMQPMIVRRVTPVLKTNPQGNQEQLMVQRLARKTGKTFEAPLVQLEDVVVNAPLQVFNAKTGLEISGTAPILREDLNNMLDQIEGQFRAARMKVGYGELASALDEQLVAQRNIKLPVLSSNTAFNFIENLRGRPRNRPTSVMYGTTGNLGEIYPIAADQIEDFLATNREIFKKNKIPSLGARKAGQTRFASTTRPRQATGAPVFNIQEAPRGRLTGIAAEDEDLLQQRRDVTGSILDESELGYAGGRSVELGSVRRPGLLQQKISPATTGIGAELQELREQLGKIEGKQPSVQPSVESMPTNVDVLSQQLLAQSKRRAGKRRNR
jgi:hypothetical protein